MKIISLLLTLLFVSHCLADQGIIAKKPYHDQIYICKKRTLYIAVDKTELTTLESALSKRWVDRINPKALIHLDTEFVLQKMQEYDIRVENIKKHFDIKFVDWYDQNITYHPAYKIGSIWRPLPQGEYESHRWLQFWEWFIREWNLLDNHERWETLRWVIRTETYNERSKDREVFVKNLVATSGGRYTYVEYNCDEIDEIGDCGYYVVFDNEKQVGVTIYDLGYTPRPMPTPPVEPVGTECPLDRTFRIN